MRRGRPDKFCSGQAARWCHRAVDCAKGGRGDAKDAGLKSETKRWLPLWEWQEVQKVLPGLEGARLDPFGRGKGV